MPRQIDWNHVYILGWWDETGRHYLTSWDGDCPYVNVVVVGATGGKVPVWAFPVKSGLELVEVPEDKVTREDQLAYARERGGYLALAWYIEEGFERKPPGPDPLWGPRT